MTDALDALVAHFIDPALFWELFWYLFAGGCATVVSFVGYSLCFRRLRLSNVWSKSLSWFAAATVAFLLMRWLAFAGTASGFWESAWKCYASRIGTAVLTVALMWLVIDKALGWDLTDRERVKSEYGWWPEAINLVVTVIEVLLNYFIAKFWVF